MARPSDDEIVTEMLKIKEKGEGTYKYLKGLGLSEIQITKFQTRISMDAQTESITEELSNSNDS